MERLRLVENPVDRLARTIEALLVIASKPLSVAELAVATEEEEERVETALGLIAGRFREGRSGVSTRSSSSSVATASSATESGFEAITSSASIVRASRSTGFSTRRRRSIP